MKQAQKNVQFVLDQKTTIDQIFGLLLQEFTLHENHPVRIKRKYLDSFDWRLYQRCLICGFDSNNSQRSFFIRHRETDDSLYEFPLDEIPRFSQDIKHQACCELLQEILGIRALVTVAVVHIKRKQVLVINKKNKTVALLHIESYSYAVQDNKGKLYDRLIVSPVKGHAKIFQTLLQSITQHLQLTCANSSLFANVLVAGGVDPAPTDLSVMPTMIDSLQTWEAVQMVLAHLLRVMRANEPGICKAIDTEFLHDYRVAVRRTRTMLGQIKHVFPARVSDYFSQEFYWLNKITGPTRDLDMYLLQFNEYTQELPPGLQNDLIQFQQFLQRHWQIEHDCLKKALSSKRYHKLVTKWQKVLDNKNIQSQETINADKPAKEIAGQRIWKLYKKVIKQGAAINAKSTDEEFHALRKTCKKFRYLIEFFHDYYPDDHIKKLIKTLKQLQENLGDFQDLSVQISQLKQFAQAMQNEQAADAKTIMAMGMLVEKLIMRKKAVREHFNQCFKAFTSSHKKTELMNLLSHPNETKNVLVGGMGSC